ncbi:MAG TPA: hypothetical protein VGQ73_01470 [Gemmatimonadales bacterium]|jgi:hypothetical protein|nr:hypothetical protein [Gemmatimonadales bacterium]
MRQILLPAALLVSACGGSRASTPPAEPVASSTQAISAFMQAAKDSNLTRMAELWGTSRGPASQTRPAEYEKRLAVMQVYLRGDSTRILSDDPVPGDEKHRRVQLALYRGTCVKQIPVTTVRSQKGWIVEGVNLSFAGNPARPCE